MLRKILNTAITAIEASAIGLVVAPTAGAALGWMFGYLSASPRHRWDEAAAMAFFFALFSAPAGLVAGAGISVLGVRTKSGVEWPLIIGAGILVGLAVAVSRFGGQVIAFAIGIAAVTWLVVGLIKWVLARRIARNSLNQWVIAAYLAAFLLMAFLVRTITTSLARVLS